MRQLVEAVGLADASAYQVALTLPYVVALAAVLAEAGWLARRSGVRRQQVLGSLATAGPMAAGAIVVGAGYTAVLGWVWALGARVGESPLAEVWRVHPLAGVLAAFVAWDLAGWAYHALGHRTRVGWAAHQVHHSGERFDLTLGLRQTWFPVHGLVVHPLLALAGFDLSVVAVCAAVSNCWQVLQHTSLPVRPPDWVAAIVMTPAAHRHHHGRGAAPVNLGPCLTVWDRLAGTWVPPGHRRPEHYGNLGPHRGAIALELAGWRVLVGDLCGPRRALVGAGIGIHRR